MKINQNNKATNQNVVNNESGVVNLNHVQPFTDMKVDGAKLSKRTIPHQEQKRYASKFQAAYIVTMIGLVADLAAIHPVLDFPVWTYIILLLVIAVWCSLADPEIYAISKSPELKQGKSGYLFDEKVCENTQDGFSVFTYRAPCIYPNCEGEIVVTEPPIRKNGNFSYFGKCTLANLEHSYGIDRNFVAYPREVDWSEPEPDTE